MRPVAGGLLRRAILGLGLGLGALTIPSEVAAQSTPRSVLTKGLGGQAQLAVGLDSGKLLARVCSVGTPCTPSGGLDLALPPSLNAATVSVAVLELEGQREVVHVRAPGPSVETAWEALVAAPTRGRAPLVIFSGSTGLVAGEYGLRRGPMLQISDGDAAGTRRLVVGTRQEDVSICGRPTVLAPKMLVPSGFELRPAKVQRLSPAERERAARIVARRLPEGPPPPAPLLLRATAASSALGDPKALTDGDLSTTWTENRGGAGRGEFVVMLAPERVPLQGFELGVRPAPDAPGGPPANAAAPRELWLATTGELYHVTLPEDAWAQPGARYEVPLPSPVNTDCVALVIESAHSSLKDPQVTLAEISARTAFTEQSVPELVTALRGGDANAVAAGVVLSTLGDPAYEAVAAAFPSLDEGGRRVALEVIDTAPCAISAPVYVAALTSKVEAHQMHATARLPRCGNEAEEALVKGYERAKTLRQAEALANQLAILAPSRAIATFVAELDRARPDRRRLLRVVIARAAGADSARASVTAALGNPRLGEVARIDLLRALGPKTAQFAPESSRQLAALLQGNPSFRARYLLLEPAAYLARHDERALAFLQRSLASDTDLHIRAQAARSVTDPALVRDALLRALDDPAVRVREAAVETAAAHRLEYAARGLQRRLEMDQWPLVRAAAAEALAELGPREETDRALVQSLQDASRHVRAPVALALGKRGVAGAAKPIRQRLLDRKEAVNVRTAAALALGLLCDEGSVEALTKYAVKLADPMDPSEDKRVGPAALAALARIDPPDLRKRLAPLLDPRAPRPTRTAAETALENAGACRRTAQPAAVAFRAR